MSAYTQQHPSRQRSARYGWDRPLQYYFLTVSDHDNEDKDEDEDGPIIYSNLNDPAATQGTYGGGLSLTQLRAQLEAHGFTMDDTETAQLRQDAGEGSTLSGVQRSLLDSLNPR